jgi:hypothetical protein
VGRVAALAGEFMLLEYAAELKGLTQLSIVRGVRRAQQLPREVREAAVRLRGHAVRVVQALKAELAEMITSSSTRRAAGQMKRIRNAHSHLQAATELLNRAADENNGQGGQTPSSAASAAAAAAIKKKQMRRQSTAVYVSSSNHDDSTAETNDVPMAPPMGPPAAPPAPASAAVSNLAAMMASFAIPPPSSGASAAAAAPAPAPTPAVGAAATTTKNLLEQIEMLKKQMETMARLQSMMPQAAAAIAANGANGQHSAAVAASGPAIPLAPSLSMSTTSRPVVPVPQAPALTPDSFFFTGIRKPAAAAADAPPPPPPGPPRTGSAPSASPMSAREAMLSEITSRTLNKTPKASSSSATGGAAITPAKKRLSSRRSGGVAAPIPSAAAAAAANAAGASSAAAAVASGSPSRAAGPALRVAGTGAPIKVFVRKLPGAGAANGGAEMSLTDGIKLASVVKLRRTEQQRSPGGTPVRDARAVMAVADPTQNLLRAAFAARFALANGGGDPTSSKKNAAAAAAAPIAKGASNTGVRGAMHTLAAHRRQSLEEKENDAATTGESWETE